MSISFKILCAVLCAMYVCILYHQDITSVVIASSAGNETIYSQHYSLDTGKFCKEPSSVFAAGCVLRGLITAR